MKVEPILIKKNEDSGVCPVLFATGGRPLSIDWSTFPSSVFFKAPNTYGAGYSAFEVELQKNSSEFPGGYYCEYFPPMGWGYPWAVSLDLTYWKTCDRIGWRLFVTSSSIGDGLSPDWQILAVTFGIAFDIGENSRGILPYGNYSLVSNASSYGSPFSPVHVSEPCRVYAVSEEIPVPPP